MESSFSIRVFLIVSLVVTEELNFAFKSFHVNLHDRVMNLHDRVMVFTFIIQFMMCPVSNSLLCVYHTVYDASIVQFIVSLVCIIANLLMWNGSE